MSGLSRFTKCRSWWPRSDIAEQECCQCVHIFAKHPRLSLYVERCCAQWEVAELVLNNHCWHKIPKKHLWFILRNSYAMKHIILDIWLSYLFIPRSSLPNTQIPSRHSLRWYFLCIHFDSSILIYCSGLPIFSCWS